jgi:hypothetical protein
MNRNEAIAHLRRFGPQAFNRDAITPFAPGDGWDVSNHTDKHSRRIYSNGETNVTYDEVFPPNGLSRDEAIEHLRRFGPQIFDSEMPFLPRDGWEVSNYTDVNDRLVYTNGEDIEITYDDVFTSTEVAGVDGTETPRNKYQRDLKGVTVGVYDVLKAFNVTCPATQHALKKMLCADHKDLQTDLDEAIVSLQRAKELAK